MALTTRQVAHLGQMLVGACNQARSANEYLLRVVNDAEALARQTGTPLADVFGPTPSAVVHEGRTAEQCLDAVKALAQMAAFITNQATTPVVGEATAIGNHLDDILAMV